MSSIESVRAYLVERYPARLFVPFAAAVFAVGAIGFDAPLDGRAALSGVTLALALILGFRVWDDLADRPRDRLNHPGRITVRVERAGPFVGLSLIAFGIALAVLFARGVARADLLVLSALVLTLAAWYGVRERLRAGSLLRAHVQLLKYPAIAFIAIPASGQTSAWSAAIALTALYVGLVVHEMIDDPTLRPPSGRAPAVGDAGVPVEHIPCYYCGSRESTHFISANDDLTGKPGTFHFVTCSTCGLRYQHPRVTLAAIGAFYDDEYIAHRKKSDWGILTGFFNWVMDRHDRQKDALVSRYVRITPDSRVLDVGCAVGTFLQKMRSRYGARVTGVDFKDLRAHPSLQGVDFRCGLFYEQDFAAERFDLVTMWHFLEHDYDPLRTLRTARDVLKPDGRLVIEVPRLDSLTFRLYRERWPGLQAPQHTVLYDRAMLERMVERAGLEIVEYLPYGAFPAFFYFFAGAAFKVLKGKGLDLSKAIYPYFVGQLLFAPLLAFEKQLNFAMQTVVCRVRA